MTVNAAVQEKLLISQDRTTAVMKRHLDMAVKIERRFTVEQIADESGVNIHTLRSYMRNEEPKDASLARALSIAVVLGPKAVNAIMALIGYAARPLDEADALKPMQITADAMAHLSIIAKAAADDRIDHTERPSTTAAADAIIATVLPLSSHGV